MFAFCFGDGTSAPCPCNNNGAPGAGCENSALTGGAILWASGTARLTADTLQLAAKGELPRTTSVLLQGNAAVQPAVFGEGLRCAGGLLSRLYVQNAVGGMISVPQGADLSISARSSALGDPILPGAMRVYQVLYKDPTTKFCGAAAGGQYNLSNAMAITWAK